MLPTLHGVSRVPVLVLPWVPCGAGLGGQLLGRTGQFFLDTIPKGRAACSCARVGSQAAVGAPASRDFPPCRTATGGRGQRADFQTAHLQQASNATYVTLQAVPEQGIPPWGTSKPCELTQGNQEEGSAIGSAGKPCSSPLPRKSQRCRVERAGGALHPMMSRSHNSPQLPGSFSPTHPVLTTATLHSDNQIALLFGKHADT